MRHFGVKIFERLELIKIWAISLFKTTPPATKIKPLKLDKKDLEIGGAYYFKRDILCELPEYFRCIKHMKKGHPDAYALYSKIGASVVPKATGIDRDIFHQTWLHGSRPAFGAVAFLGDNNEKSLGMKFGYFQKFTEWVPGVEKVSGDLYQIVVFYVARYRKKMLGIPCAFYVAIDGNCGVKVLKEQNTHMIKIESKNPTSRRRGGSCFYLPHKSFGIPQMFIDWASEHNKTPDEFATEITAIITSFHASANSHVRVECSRKKETAVFGIDMLRTPYFFSDRDPIFATEGGHKKKIFHIVRTHKRVNPDYSESYVKSHFRGIRSFDWNGYHINITLPEYHHRPVIGMEIGAIEVDEDEHQDENLIGSDILAGVLHEHIKDAAREAAWKKTRKAA